jgi:hypothetical protein
MIQPAEQTGREEALVHVQVRYLPAAEPFKRSYDDETVVTSVRRDAMSFFGVQDHTDRDRHDFFLEFEGRRITETSQTLEQLFGRDRRDAHFNLIEQITAGSS